MSWTSGLLARFESKLSQDVDDVPEVSDTGGRGKQFEKTFIAALKLLGLRFTENRYAGAGWDIHPDPDDDGWSKLLPRVGINIKVYSTKSMVGSSIFSAMLPWGEDLPKDFDFKRAELRLKRQMNKLGWNRVRFLSARSPEVEKEIADAVTTGNAEALRELMTRRNFRLRYLSSDYEVQVKTRDGKISSIAVIKSGKTFMRSEPPRRVGGSAGYVAFKREAQTGVKDIRIVKREIKQ